MNRAVITVIGRDQPGIIAAVAAVLAEQQANICDVSQTLMGDIFTMSMLIDIAAVTTDFQTLQIALTAIGEQLGVDIHAQREAVFRAMSTVAG